MRHHTLSLGLLLGLQGCAYQQAMTRGERAAMAQDWDRAYYAYRFADALEPGRAAEEVAQARSAAAGAELDAADAALAAQDFAGAAEHLERAEDRDPAHPRLAAVRSAARLAMAAELSRRMAADEPLRTTYELAVLAKRIDPTAPQFEDATAALRERIAADAHALVDDERYAEARALARTIAEVEPEHTTRGEALDAEVTDGWVGALVADAIAAERAHPGLAAVHYARAFEVGGRAEHRGATEHALQAAASAASLSVFVDSKGDGGRHWRLRKAVRATVDASPGVEPGWSSSWDLQALVYSNGERCKETKAAVPLEKEYVAGTRMVPNPAYVALSAELTAAEKARDTAKAALSKAQASLEPVAAQAKELQRARDDAHAAHEAAVARQLDSERQLKLAEEREAKLATMAAGGDPAMTVTAKAQQAVVAEWAEKVASERLVAGAAKKKLDAATAKLEPVRAEAERQAAVTAEADARHAAAEQAAAELAAKRRATVDMLSEDVRQTFRYAETTWTLTCDATATVYFGTRWKTGLVKKQSFPGRVSTTDLARPGLRAAQVEEDPKLYPRDQADLVVELDGATHQAIAAAIEAYVAESFDRRIEAALASSHTAQATDALIGLYAGAPERLDGADRERLAAHLKAHYGIEDPAVLGVVPAPAAAPEAEAPPIEEPAVAEN